MRIVPVFLLFISLLLSQCANPLPPEGGAEDTQPPQIDSLKSTANFQTNFEKQRIELTFDEWVVLEDVFNQVVVSPPLEYEYDVRLRGKTVRFDFAEEEELRPNATYTINFGEAVKDLNEKNPAENLRFVFSTGPYLDSLELQGQLIDAFNGEPAAGVLFMLYENQADSVVRTERPFYFARANKEGQFKIENVKAGTFKGFALEDANFNYKYDLETEKIGFPEQLIEMQDTIRQSLTVKVFETAAGLRLMDDEQRYGLVKLVFNQKPEDYELVYPDVGQRIIEEIEKDTLKIWYHQPDTTPWSLIVRQDTILQDTLEVENVTDRASFLELAGLKALNLKAGKSVTRINPTKPLPINFNLPIDSFRQSGITVFEDTLRTPVSFTITKDSLNPRIFQLGFVWKENIPYEVQILPGSFTSMYGIQNKDTIRQKLLPDPLKQFGNIKLNLTGLSADSSYVLQLLNKEKKVVEERNIRGVSALVQSYTALSPGQYSLLIIHDWNSNGRWDVGSYDQYRQPEPIFRRELEQLRANWDLEVEVLVE